MDNDNCIFCQIVQGKLPSYKIYEDKLCLAFLDINPIRKGHVLIIPKIHCDYIFDQDEKTFTHLFSKATHISKALKKAFKAEKIGLAIEGLSIPHVHIHLVPVYNINDLDPNLAKPASKIELKETHELVKKYLK